MSCEWTEIAPPRVPCQQFLLEGMTAGRYILDAGCGQGALMAELVRRGCSAVRRARSIVRLYHPVSL